MSKMGVWDGGRKKREEELGRKEGKDEENATRQGKLKGRQGPSKKKGKT